MAIYCCDPHSPCQRGTNENTVQWAAAAIISEGHRPVRSLTRTAARGRRRTEQPTPKTHRPSPPERGRPALVRPIQCPTVGPDRLDIFSGSLYPSGACPSTCEQASLMQTLADTARHARPTGSLLVDVAHDEEGRAQYGHHVGHQCARQQLREHLHVVE